MSYDPTQQVPPPQYPPQQGYPQPGYTQQGYPQQPGYPPPYPQQPPAPPTYQQYGTPPPPPGAGFDFNAFWKKLGTTGQVCLISGVVLFLSLLFTWYSESISCTGSLCRSITNLDSYARSANAWGIANGGISLNIESASGTQSFSFPLLWLVILASVALIVLPILGALGKMAAQQTQLFVLIAAGLAVLIEIIYMFSAFSSLTPLKDDITQAERGLGDTTIKMSTGPAIGFWLGLLVTLAAGGVYLYFGYLKKPAAAGYPLPYQQVAQYPGSQPYPPPPTPYPGSQPSVPPTQYQQPPQYPGQYPGQQPPPYPGQ